MSSPPPRPFGPGAALLLLLVTFASNVAILLIGDSLSDGPVGPLFYVAAAVLAPLVAVYVGLVRHAPDEPTAPALGLGLPRGRAWAHLGLGVMLAAALAPLVRALTDVMLALPVDTLADEATAEWQAALQQPATQALIAVAQIALIPFTREALFRGFMQPRLARVVGVRRGVSLVVLLDLVTLAFADHVPRALIASLPLSILALASGTTWAPVLAHVGLVLGPVGVAILWPASTPPILLVGAAALSLGLLALIWRLRVEPTGSAPTGPS